MSQKAQIQSYDLEGTANLQKVKSGRKKKEETSRYLETPMNPYYKVYQRLMKYLDSIGLIHGLCFTTQLRKSLKQFNKYPDLQWKQSNYGWYYAEQLHNLRTDGSLMRRVRRIMFSLKSRCRKIKNQAKQIEFQQKNVQLNTLENWTFNKIVDFIIRPGQMVDPECRQQFYTLNITLLQSIFCKKINGKNKTQKYALKFFQISRFFSRKFTTFKKKNWIEMKRCAPEEIDKHFIKMFVFFKKNYQDILYNFYEWNQYNMDMKKLFDEQNQNSHNTKQADKQTEKKIIPQE